MNQDRGRRVHQTQSRQTSLNRTGGEDDGTHTALRWEAYGRREDENGHLPFGRLCTCRSPAYGRGQHPGRSLSPYYGPGPSLALSLSPDRMASGLLVRVLGRRR